MNVNETSPDNEPWQNVPYVNFNRDNRKVKLNANWYDNANDNLAVPVFRESLLKEKERCSLLFLL